MDDPGRFIFIFQSELARINRELVRRPSIETGGDLFGFWQHDGSPIVYCALGPGPNARHESAAFYQDIDWLTNEGRRLNDAFGLQHVGEWHSHHQMNLYHPSGGDVSTIQYAMNQHRFERFALVICNVELVSASTGRQEYLSHQNNSESSVHSLTLSAYLFDEKQRKSYRETPWVVLPKQSPLSDASDDPAPCCDTVILRPSIVSLDTLRGRSAHVQPVASLGPTWFAEASNQQRLQAEMLRFEILGMKPKMVLSKDNQLSIKVPAPDGIVHYRLFEGFPHSAPKAVYVDDLGREQPFKLSWQAEFNLADIHADAIATLKTPTLHELIVELQRLERSKDRKAKIALGGDGIDLEVRYEHGKIRFSFSEPPAPIRVFSRNFKGREIEIPIKCNRHRPSPEELFQEVENWIQS